LPEPHATCGDGVVQTQFGELCGDGIVLTFSPPDLVPLDSILPSEPLLLMGAGPVPIPHAVARANGVVINDLGETMDRVIEHLS
jgi:hypothetical protein